MSIYVTMIDRFMSGWGPAEGKTNIYMVECDNWEQAEQIERAGNARDDMDKVAIRGNKKPYYNSRQYLVTEKHYSDLGGMWIGED